MVLVASANWAHIGSTMKPDRFAELLSAWPTRRGPLHLKLSAAIQDAITQGSLLPGVRLPAERALAQALSLSRTTIVTAYGHLRDSGWLESRTGSGTWVSRTHAIGVRSMAHASAVSRGSLLNLLQVNDPSIIDLAMSITEPAADLVEEAINRAHEDIVDLLRQRIPMPLGLPTLRQAVADFYTDAGTPTTQEQILITTGAQQALSLITSLFVHRGDPVLVENPTYFGALEVFRFAGARMSPLPVGKDHVAPDALARKIAATHPRLVYLTPTGHNPTGVTMPSAARQMVARHAELHEVPIIEDETLADLVLKGSKPRSVASYSATAPILTIGSLSKLVCCGLRIGWIRGPVSLIHRLAKVKSAADLGSSHMTQVIAAELFPHLNRIRSQRTMELRAKRDLVVRSLRARGRDWTFPEPQGGMSLWLRLANSDTRVLAQVALRHGVSVVPGNLFSVDESHSEYIRLPFLLSLDLLQSGVQRLLDSCEEIDASPATCTDECVIV